MLYNGAYFYDASLTDEVQLQNLKAGGMNLGKLAYNLRFSSDRVPRSNPWSRSSFDGDFILIAEFSENEGPKPVVSQIYISLLLQSIHRGSER